MNKRTIGATVAAVGLAVLAVSLLANTLGIGDSGGAFGFKQIAGAVAGALLAVVGIMFAARK